MTATTALTAPRGFFFPTLARRWLGLLLFSFFLLHPTSLLQAQPRKVSIEKVEVGFKAGVGQETRFKAGAWTPVYVDLQAPKGLLPKEAELLIETADSDNLRNRYQVDVPAIEEEQTITVLTYLRPGNMNSDINVIVRGRDGREIHSVKAQKFSQHSLSPNQFLYLVAGSRLPRLKGALLKKPGEENRPDEDMDDSGARRFAYLDRVEQLPTRWFGYQGADLLILTTSKETFIKGLVEERNQCKEALAEWVRRGGRLVVCVGQNHQLARQFLTQTKLIDCEVKGSVYRRHLGLSPWIAVENHRRVRLPAPGVEVAMLQPGKGVDVLVHERDFADDVDDDKKVDEQDRPLMVQASYGLGRVILVGFDLDQSPFTSWSGQNDFYRKLQSEMEPRTIRDDQQGGMGWSNSSTELAGSLQANLETFEDIPVVSFGWVALFIFLYILVVGPLDYLFLKKVVKRLELTWITFPLVVVVVSTLAYFTAYYLKGNDLKINKVDLVEIDLHQPKVYGSTWFTLFSPRIQNYTVGTAPSTDWAPPPRAPESNPFSTLVGWMGKPGDDWGGSSRSGSQGLFRRTYNYAPDAAGLEGVPIQVWATKSFSSSWEAPMPEQALITARLFHPQGKPEAIAGTITSNLPVELQDVVLLHRDQVYSLDKLSPGVPTQAQHRGAGQSQRLDQWLNDPLFDMQQSPQQRGNRFAPPQMVQSSVSTVLKSALFHKRAEGNVMNNSALRHLDQSWRLARKDEVMLFGRIAPAPAGAAEKTNEEAVASSRLWLGQLPGANSKPPTLGGTMTQRTYVRVFIPVTSRE